MEQKTPFRPSQPPIAPPIFVVSETEVYRTEVNDKPFFHHLNFLTMKIDNLLPGQARDIVGGDGDPLNCWPDPDNPDPGFPWNLPGFPPPY